MKKLIIIVSILMLALITLFLGGGDKAKKEISSAANDRDEEMVGPRGEEIFIGSGGGRYFMRNGRKIYVGYKNKKSDAS